MPWSCHVLIHFHIATASEMWCCISHLLLCATNKLVANRRQLAYSLEVDFYALAFAYVYVCVSTTYTSIQYL